MRVNDQRFFLKRTVNKTALLTVCFYHSDKTYDKKRQSLTFTVRKKTNIFIIIIQWLHKEGESFFFCKMIIPSNRIFYVFMLFTSFAKPKTSYLDTHMLAIKPSHGLYCTIKKDYWKVMLSWVDKHFFFWLMTYWPYMACIDNGSDKIMRRAAKANVWKSIGGKGAMQKREKLLIYYMRLILQAWALSIIFFFSECVMHTVQCIEQRAGNFFWSWKCFINNSQFVQCHNVKKLIFFPCVKNHTGKFDTLISKSVLSRWLNTRTFYFRHWIEAHSGLFKKEISMEKLFTLHVMRKKGVTTATSNIQCISIFTH